MRYMLWFRDENRHTKTNHCDLKAGIEAALPARNKE